MSRLLKIGILAYILADLVFVFYLQYHNNIDGDLVEIVLPTKLYEQTLRNPFGEDVLLRHAKYAGSNGFLGYWLIHNYFRTVPFLFQKITTPLNSLYMACATSTVLMKMLYIYVLSAMASGTYRVFSKRFLLAAIIICPVIQTGAYRWLMGIVDPMLISMFAYTRVNILILLFFLPFFMEIYHGRKTNYGPVLTTMLVLLAIYNGYNGPLAGPLICIVYALMLAAMFFRNMKELVSLPFGRRIWVSVSAIPRLHYILGVIVLLSSAYCYYIGLANAESYVQQMPLSVRYSRLPKGLWEHFSTKGLWLLSLMIIVNAGILYARRDDAKAKRTINLMWWTFLFCTIFVLMLPLGGYRFYRPNIIRRDIFSPALVGMVGFFGISAFYILQTISARYKKIYVAFLTMSLAHFALANTRDIPDNSCERAAIEHVVASKDKIVRLEEQCTIFNWFIVRDYRESEKITRVMNLWGILKEEKYFYQDTIVNGVRVPDQVKVYF